MSRSNTVDEHAHERRLTEDSTTEDRTEWFASSALRMGLVLIGVILLLFALGQAVGMDFIGMISEALSTSTGRWLLVAFFALLLIVVAMRGYVTRIG